MEIFSFLIIVGLLLSSCTTDEGNEEMAIFKNDSELNKWHNKQHLWMMYQDKKKKQAWKHTNHSKTESVPTNAAFVNVQKPLVLDRINSDEPQTAYSEVGVLENSEYEHENAVLQEH